VSGATCSPAESPSGVVDVRTPSLHVLLIVNYEIDEEKLLDGQHVIESRSEVQAVAISLIRYSRSHIPTIALNAS
jgi:hypothetical protein